MPPATASPPFEEGACVVCGKRSNRVVWSENTYQSRACECGTLYVSPRPIAGEIDATRDGHHASFYSLSARTKLRWLARYVSPGRFLEIGAGEGDFLAAARGYGHSIAAIEADPDRAERLRRRLGVEVECALIEESQWVDGAFDVVFHCDLLSHFEDPHRALRRMSRLLRPGGCLFFEVGLMAGVSPLWYRLIGELGLPQHRWFFSERALVRLLTDCGLEIEHRVCFNLVPAHVTGYVAIQARALMRRTFGSVWKYSSTTATTPSASTRQLRRVANHLRYGFPGLAWLGGPQTGLFIARPVPAPQSIAGNMSTDSKHRADAVETC
jgi:SAM-dependent methyltransferase